METWPQPWAGGDLEALQGSHSAVGTPWPPWAETLATPIPEDSWVQDSTQLPRSLPRGGALAFLGTRELASEELVICSGHR